MATSISVFQPQGIARLVSTIESAVGRPWKPLARSLERLATRLGGLASLGEHVGRSEVELVFWVHKAFVAGFILALALTSLRG